MELGSTFGLRLRDWRSTRGLSQLDLGLAAGVSARHISFLETGRSRPSRDMVVRLAQVLDVPLRECNELLLAAGFAPRYGERPLSDAELHQVRKALRFLLDAHEPYPAFVLDRRWNIVLCNRPVERLLASLLPAGGAIAVTDLNALDLVFQPRRLRESILNWQQVARAMLRRLRQQLTRYPRDEELLCRWHEIRAQPEVAEIEREVDGDELTGVFVPLELAVGDRVLAWFSTLAVLGTPVDATLEELVIESFFPADEATRQAAEEMALAAGTERRP